MSSAAYTLSDEARDTMRDFLRRLVQTPSPPGEEHAVAELIQQELARSGADVAVDSSGNVIVQLGTGNGPTLAFNAHMDTVRPASGVWPHPPFEAAVEDGIMYGMGACDMKASIAAMTYAARSLLEAGTELKGQLTLAFVVQEEVAEGMAMRALVEESKLKPDWVVLGEPTNMQVSRGQRGRVMFRVTAFGKSSHGARPDLGENAILAAMRLIFGVDLLSAELKIDPFMGPGSIAVTRIESESGSLNAIPDRCSFYVDRRLTLGETVTMAQAELERVISTEGLRAEVEITEFKGTTYTGKSVTQNEAYSPWALAPDHPLIEATVEAVKAVRGTAPERILWPFSTDGVYTMGEAEIPTVGFGPGNQDDAHTIRDSVRLDDVADAAQAYALLAAKLLE